MRKIGVVSHLSRRKRILVKAIVIPKLNTTVYDENNNEVGKVIDVLGPVKEPYISIKPNKKEGLEELIGKEIFIKNTKNG
jgi:RNA-binding protein involved in rRNA processing